MSRNGALLTDWQDIYNGVNERRKAVMFASSAAALDLVPVVQSENHITHNAVSGMVGKLPVGHFCDTSDPLKFRTWDTLDDTGSVPVDVNWLDSGSPVLLCKYVPQYGSYPVRGALLERSGWFLDWMDDALLLMDKSASIVVTDSRPFEQAEAHATQYKASFTWDQYGTGALWDNVASEEVQGVTITSYADLWSYASQHFHAIQDYPRIDASISTTLQTVEIQYSSWQGVPPGVIPADLTLYYSATGDNLGYTPTSYQQSGGPYVHGYATVTQQNVTRLSPFTFGFTSAVIPSSAPAPGYYTHETLTDVYAVWDFAPYMQY